MNPKFAIFAFLSLISIAGAIDFPSRFPNADLSHILHWGTYKSHCYHAITEQTPNGAPMTLALQLAPKLTVPDINNLYYYFRDIQSPDNAQTQLYYTYHNGYYFAEQALDFEGVPITNTFLKTNVTNVHQSWLSLTEFGQSQGLDEITVFYSIGLESYYNNDTRYIQYNPANGQVAVYTPGNPLPQHFRFVVYQNGQIDNSGVELYYQSFDNLNRSTLWQIPNYTNSSLGYHFSKDYLTLANKTASNAQNTSLLLVQMKIPLNKNPSLLVMYDSSINIVTVPDYKTLQSQIAARETEFMKDFNTVFPNISDHNQKDVALYALSNLIGGIIYYYGPILITEDPNPQPPLPFFTATPTRNSFERGFLWDEGFHDLLICRWSPDLCLATMNLWFASQYKTGWIAREQARGPEIQSMIPGAFLFQSDLEGNPPTLMMAIDYVLNNPANQKIMANFLQTNYGRIYKWWNWFYSSQQVYDSQGHGTNLFLWSYKNFSGGIQYFGSGLDDFPRGDPGLISKYHIDLQVWEIMFAQVMAKLANFMNDKGNVTFFTQLTQTLTNNLNVYLDPVDNLYKDVYQYINDSSKTVHSTHVGYISLLPLLLNLTQENNAAFNATLNLVDPSINGVMWSSSGILSLARNDSYFEGNSDYWTGPIWINFNYMLLKAIHNYYPKNTRAQSIYANLYTAIVGVVVKNFENTGYIWEHYNFTTTLGEGNHPFTGWSTLIVFPICGDYN